MLERCDQARAHLANFRYVLSGKILKKIFSGFRQPYHDPAPILLTDPAMDHFALLHAVYQFDRAVVAELQSFGKITDGGAVSFPGKASYRQEQLVLLWFQASRASSILAETQELADLVAELREGLVLSGRDIFRFHKESVQSC
jgi:hypothetical protein